MLLLLLDPVKHRRICLCKRTSIFVGKRQGQVIPMRRFVFAALLAFSCACAFAVNMRDTVQKEIRVNGETITRPMTIREFSEYDSSGSLIHHKDGFKESWHEYDDAGREIYSKEHDFLAPSRIEWRHEFDGKGRKIHSKSSKGTEKWFEYDGKGQLIRSVSTRFERKHDNGPRPIGWESIQRDTSRYEYDGKGRLIHSMEKDGRSVDENWYEYDGKGRNTYRKHEIAYRHLSYEVRYQYDGNGNLIRVQIHEPGRIDRGHTNDTYEWRHEYDGKGQLLHSKKTDGFEEWYEYDGKGNQICYRVSRGIIIWTDYTFWENGKVKTKTEYVYIPPDYAQP